jgi:hypothetical protein
MWHFPTLVGTTILVHEAENGYSRPTVYSILTF